MTPDTPNSRANKELAAGLVMLIAGLFIMFSYGGTVFFLLLGVILMIVGVAFLNLSSMRKTPTHAQLYVKDAMRGGFLIPIAQGIEQLIGIKD